MSRSLNRVELIGNLTRDPELRYTPKGSSVCNFGMATNRAWTTEQGEKKEETEFHHIVVWGKLAELCSQYLSKGRKVYVEGRLSTRTWTAQDGTQRNRTEVVIDDMLMLDSKSTASAPQPSQGAGQRAAAPVGDAGQPGDPSQDVDVDEVDKGIAQQKAEQAKEGATPGQG
jgi:single-strand DNA-binding protein